MCVIVIAERKRWRNFLSGFSEMVKRRIIYICILIVNSFVIRFMVKFIFEKIIKTFERVMKFWYLKVFMLRKEKDQFYWIFLSFENSLISIFIFPLLIQISREIIFFIGILKRMRRTNASSFEEEKSSTQFLLVWAFCSLFMGQRFTIIATESVSVSLTMLPPS